MGVVAFNGRVVNKEFVADSGLLQHLLQLCNAAAYFVGLALEEVFAVFGVAEPVAAGNVGRIVLHISNKV